MTATCSTHAVQTTHTLALPRARAGHPHAARVTDWAEELDSLKAMKKKGPPPSASVAHVHPPPIHMQKPPSTKPT